MLVAYRLAGLSALGAHYASVNRRAQCSAISDRSLTAFLHIGSKSEDWREIAGLATTASPHRWAIQTAAPVSDRETVPDAAAEPLRNGRLHGAPSSSSDRRTY